MVPKLQISFYILQDTPLTGSYVALYDFKGRHDDEIDLSAGCKVNMFLKTSFPTDFGSKNIDPLYVKCGPCEDIFTLGWAILFYAVTLHGFLKYFWIKV